MYAEFPRQTGLRIFNFVCAWFDEKDYYQFYPLHVVKKIADSKKKRKIYYKSGEVVVVSKENILKIVEPRVRGQTYVCQV